MKQPHTPETMASLRSALAYWEDKLAKVNNDLRFVEGRLRSELLEEQSLLNCIIDQHRGRLIYHLSRVIAELEERHIKTLNESDVCEDYYEWAMQQQEANRMKAEINKLKERYAELAA